MVLIPFTYSITQGIVWGFLSWTLIRILSGKAKEIGLPLLIIDAFALLSLFLG
jgi:AGZA family xanthine/uracil permease-like MFS transporter